MKTEMEIFQPLVTQANSLPDGHDWLNEVSDRKVGENLPRGLGLLARSGAGLRRALLMSVLLGLVSLAELGVLLLMPKPEALVVWEERGMKALIGETP